MDWIGLIKQNGKERGITNILDNFFHMSSRYFNLIPNEFYFTIVHLKKSNTDLLYIGKYDKMSSDGRHSMWKNLYEVDIDDGGHLVRIKREYKLPRTAVHFRLNPADLEHHYENMTRAEKYALSETLTKKQIPFEIQREIVKYVEPYSRTTEPMLPAFVPHKTSKKGGKKRTKRNKITTKHNRKHRFIRTRRA